MKKFLKKVLSGLTHNNLLWRFLKPISVLGIHLGNARNSFILRNSQQKIENTFFLPLEVLNGPFKGMKYPEFNAFDSTIYPKLLGCYEKELWKTIDQLKNNRYTEILNIGCAEGYYAVGLGLLMPNARIHAYEISEEARSLCRKMAAINNLPENIIINSECTAEDLNAFHFTGPGLIVCDCEGCEKKLFNYTNVLNLRNCDLIIETHDFIDISISTYIKAIFRATHTIESIKSIDDIEKALIYDLKELKNLDLSQRKLLVEERRPTIMEWVICKHKMAD